MSTDASLGVLEGYKVLDFTQYVAGPTVTLMMAEMGAEIIKVELTPDGDKTRVAPMLVAGRSGYYVQHNRGKKSLCRDASLPKARRSSGHWWPRSTWWWKTSRPG